MSLFNIIVCFLYLNGHFLNGYHTIYKYQLKHLRNIPFYCSSIESDSCGCNSEDIHEVNASQDLAIKESSAFIIDITSSKVTEDEISNENIIKIVNLETSDEQCNHLCWKCLGYIYDNETKLYSNDNVFPKWKSKYPNPPDVIGVTRLYHSEIDKPVRDASMNLMRSIPRDFKGSCIRSLEPLGFRGYKLKDLTPNKTRRAQLVNWIIFYREKLHNKSLEQLRQEKEQELANTEQQSQVLADLPSERNYQKLRLD